MPAIFDIANQTSGAASASVGGTAYVGPVVGVSDQYVAPITADNLNVGTDSQSVFIHTSAGDDAIAVSEGRNVLDGGSGSNFLTGGSGQDTFFLDGRGMSVTWSTIVNFGSGYDGSLYGLPVIPADDATIFGFRPDVSRITWAENQGAQGYLGATMHIDLRGSGNIDASLTFAGLSVITASSLLEQTGTVDGTSYLHIVA